jgi:hypothetical protein
MMRTVRTGCGPSWPISACRVLIEGMVIDVMVMYRYIYILVGGLEPWNFMTFHSVGNVTLPTDELIFFRGVAQPQTSIGF